MKGVMDRLDEHFEKAVDLLLACKGRVIVTGMGKSGIIARKIAATMSSTGTPSLFLHPAEGVHGDLGMIVKGDVCIALSNSGETAEIVKLLPIIKRFNIPLISIVGRINSTLAVRSDCVLDAVVEKEACPLNLAPTASTTVALALGDALSVALLEKRGFSKEDFAIYHPSGALGKKLLLKVEDLMHTGDRLPVTSIDKKVSDAVFMMSAKGFGCTAVVDDKGVLAGIITDGDLRRGLEKHENLFSMNIKDLQIKYPKVIDKNSLAAKALSIMEQFSITSLFIVDSETRPVGIIHLHDLLKEGIV
ncbi:MAG: SIS domain-containing protein [Deferribacterales bacterium]